MMRDYPPYPNPETRLTIQAEPGSLLFLDFDLETTGLSRSKKDIIELASIMLDHEGITDEDSSFYSLMKPQESTPLFISELTSITNEMVKDALPFPDIMTDFLYFYREVLTKVNVRQQQIVLVAHNGTRFDIPFLF